MVNGRWFLVLLFFVSGLLFGLQGDALLELEKCFVSLKQLLSSSLVAFSLLEHVKALNFKGFVNKEILWKLLLQLVGKLSLLLFLEVSLFLQTSHDKAMSECADFKLLFANITGKLFFLFK